MLERLKAAEEKYEEINSSLMDADVINDQDRYKKLMKEYKTLTPLVEKYREYKKAESEYNEAKEKYDNAVAAKESATKKVQALADELKKELDKEPVFIGLKARHKYRANNNAGQTVFGETKFLFNKDLTEVVAEYDMDGEE